MSEQSLLSGVNRTSRLRPPISDFDPTETLAAPNGRALDAGFLAPIEIAALAAKMPSSEIGFHMQRRDFITLIGGAAAAWPVAARGQSAVSPRRVGWLVGLEESDPEARRRTAAFVQQLEHLGWTIGRNIQIDYRWLSDSVDRNENYVEELAALKPDVLVTSSTPAVKAFRHLTRTIPIVFAIVTDPVSSGLVTSLTSPGGNATGFTNFEFTMGGKWLEVLKQAAPRLAKVALIYNPKTTPYAGYLKSIEASAASLGVELIARGVADTTEIKQVIEVTGTASHGGLIIFPDFFTAANHLFIIASAAQDRVPAIYPYRYFAVDGGLMSYGVNTAEEFRRAATYVDRILRGANPGELPVQAPNKFEFVVNLKTARALDLTISSTLLAVADEVIE
jgi:putative ABC transport system substrate-binding protein